MRDEPDPAPLLIAPLPAPTPPTPSGSPGEGSPYPKAELLPRLLARLFDLMVCGALIALMHRAGAAAATVYLLLGDALFRGQSLGKKAMGLKVVNVDTGATPETSAMIIRNAVLFIPCFGLVELIVYFTNKDKRRLGDQWSKCTVIAA